MKDTLTPRLNALSHDDWRLAMLRKAGTLAVREAQHLVPVKTGNLRRSIRLANVNKDRAQILAGGTRDVGYAAAVEFGTKPHVILPRHKKALAFASQHALNRSAGMGLVKAGSTLKFRLSGSLTAGSQKRYGSAAFTVVRRVHHPGTAAKPYLVPGAEKAMKDIGIEGIVKAWNDAA